MHWIVGLFPLVVFVGMIALLWSWYRRRDERRRDPLRAEAGAPIPSPSGPVRPALPDQATPAWLSTLIRGSLLLIVAAVAAWIYASCQLAGLMDSADVSLSVLMASVLSAIGLWLLTRAPDGAGRWYRAARAAIRIAALAEMCRCAYGVYVHVVGAASGAERAVAAAGVVVGTATEFVLVCRLWYKGVLSGVVGARRLRKVFRSFMWIALVVMLLGIGMQAFDWDDTVRKAQEDAAARPGFNWASYPLGQRLHWWAFISAYIGLGMFLDIMLLRGLLKARASLMGGAQQDELPPEAS
ncbi:MAG: hypothetical protein ACYTFO_00350 [Planctomycetota bacterium]|jgi:hypothetical protein